MTLGALRKLIRYNKVERIAYVAHRGKRDAIVFNFQMTAVQDEEKKYLNSIALHISALALASPGVAYIGCRSCSETSTCVVRFCVCATCDM